MAYDEGLAQRIRETLAEHGFISEKRMFGGIAFMVNGNMCCGVIGHELMVRVGPAAWDNALAQPHARKMDFTKRPMTGFVYVAAEGIESDSELAAWVDRGIAFAGALPPK